MSSYGNECDVCDWESSCFDAPMDNCKDFSNGTVKQLEMARLQIGKTIDIIKQGEAHDREIEKKTLISFMEWLTKSTAFDGIEMRGLRDVRNNLFKIDEVLERYENWKREKKKC